MESELHIKRQKALAREMRKSHWWQRILQKCKCYYCQKDLTRDEVTMDHVVPLSRGGFSTKGNIVPSCKDCNTLKRDRTAAELYFPACQTSNVSILTEVDEGSSETSFP